MRSTRSCSTSAQSTVQPDEGQNAGAITVSGIIRDVAGKRAFDLILEKLSDAAGRKLGVDESVYRSETETGHRNRAIGHLLRNFDAITGAVDETLDVYFRQCSILVTATDLARMGATLANVGENPETGRQVFEHTAVRNTLAVMFTCGMYDYAGAWAYDVGVPAKSGVGGGILGVVNRQLGIGSYSPRLDAKGNSVRGVAVFKELADELGLHAFECSNVGSAYVRSLIFTARIEPDASQCAGSGSCVSARSRSAPERTRRRRCAGARPSAVG